MLIKLGQIRPELPGTVGTNRYGGPELPGRASMSCRGQRGRRNIQWIAVQFNRCGRLGVGVGWWFVKDGDGNEGQQEVKARYCSYIIYEFLRKELAPR